MEKIMLLTKIFGQSKGIKTRLGFALVLLGQVAQSIPQAAPYAGLINEVGLWLGGVGLAHFGESVLLGSPKENV